MTSLGNAAVIVALAAALGCSAGGVVPEPDSGAGDAGVPDGPLDGGAQGDAGAPDGGPPDGGPPDGEAQGDAGAPDSGRLDGGGSGCEPFGRYGVPAVTFTLPPPANGSLYFPDVQAAFPSVDWANVERLYIQAGAYRLINLGNLPDRPETRPLVITNLGGQVVIVPSATVNQGYIWSMNGGSNWILTGRYDPDSRTGHAGYPGHRCGAYATSRGRYGFLSDDQFRSGGHMGLGIGGARSFEVEYLEITRSGFAGLRANRGAGPDGGVGQMDNVRLHDLYIHDTRSEGIYYGSTQAPPTPLSPRLQVYNNRIVRSGTEALQLQNVGDGSEVHHNVMAWGAIDWRATFQPYQDSNSQTSIREGNVRFHHNVFLGGAANLLSFFSGPEGTDRARHVELSDNYFADTLQLGSYIGGTSDAGSSYRWERNAFRGLDFGYSQLDPTATDPKVVFRISGNVASPVWLKDNQWEGPRQLVFGLDGGTGVVGRVTATGNVNGLVPPFEFVATGLPAGRKTRDLELWTDRATRALNSPLVTYPIGALVMHDAELYEALKANSNVRPPDDPVTWRKLALPADDLRTLPGSSWAGRGIGLLDRAP